MSEGFTFGRMSRTKLIGVHPDLVLVVSRGLLYSRVDFAITEGVRSYERQKDLVAQGKSWTLNSNHLVQPDGFAHAIDVMAVGDLNADGVVDAHDKGIAWTRGFYHDIADAMKQAAEELGIGIRWGGDFAGRYDGPHFELYP